MASLTASHEVDAATESTKLIGDSNNVFINPDHYHKCCEQMLALWRKSQYCDVNLVIINTSGTPTACVAAHRVVIASTIPFFAVMLGMQMGDDKEISLHGYESTAVKSLIEYAYTGRLDLKSASSVQDLLVTAKKFSLPDIVSFCVDFLTREISASNCIGIREFSTAQDLNDLHELSKQYVIQNFSSVSREEEFLHLPVEKVIELIKSHEILVDSEEDVYNCITRWINHDLPMRSDHADDLYDYVKFPVMSQRFLETVASKNKLLQSSDKGNVYLKDGFEYHENPAAIMFSNPKKTQPRRSAEGVICVVGGESDSSTTLNSFTIHNPHEAKWIDGPPMSYKRSRLAVAILQGELYAVGGYDMGYSLSLCEKYSASENCWKEISPLINARSGLAVISLGNRLFAMGGYTGSVHLHTVEVYNPLTDEWTPGPPMLEARSDLSAVYLNQYVYAIGGRNSTGDLRSVERFDLMNRKWEFVSSMNTPRTGGAAALLGNEILVCGGQGDKEIINMAETYDTETDLWEPMVSVMGNARVGFAMVSLGNHIYAIGGSNLSGYLDSVEHYDPRQHKWVESTTKLPCCRFAPAAVTLSRKELHHQ